MKISAIIQARTGSQRLPGKVLMKLSGKPVLGHVVSRVKKAKTVQKVIVATTVLKEDLKIVELVCRWGVGVYCGSENDVLDRYYQAARLFELDHIVRITADCPMIDPDIIDQVVKFYFKNKADYASNALVPTFPDGLDIEVFSFKALEESWRKACWRSEREHVTNYITRRKRKSFKLASYEYKTDLGGKRWTLDNPEDWKFIKVIFKHLYYRNPYFGFKEVLHLLKQHPELESMNSHIIRNEGYLKSIREDERIK